ncbi:cell wall metabolism sensor histidine kinase WalK [Nocardia sp. BMG111209]|uniref:sensor histidine kinase n=1 Tax=Nocardia sp. BMG111209 TaxID=1160137 RepID=UPI0007C50329|nr:HAMP domain-containing sensor histidine kinase [Nocardia sp. BMG111209]
MVDLSLLTRPGRWGLRARSAVLSTAVLAVVFGLGALAALWVMYRSLLGSVDSTAAARADELSGQLTQRSPAQVSDTLFARDRTLVAVQVIDAAGAVVRASPGASTAGPLLTPVPDSVTGIEVPGEDDVRAATRTGSGPPGTFTVLVAVSNEEAEETVRNVAIVVGVVAPLVLLASAAATYALVGRSLRSVEAIRRQVAAIGSGRLGDRVPVPLAADEIAGLAVTMNAMLDRIQAADTAQRRFIADASHELRSPLATVIAALELGRDHPGMLDTDMIDRTALPEAHRIKDLVEDMLTLAAADENGSRPVGVDVDLDDLAAATVTTLRHDHPELIVTGRFHPARVVGDPAALQRMIRNLTDNAAAHARTRVEVTVAGSGTVARVVVDDDGPGIPRADRERVFQRFVRLEDDRARASGGTGLGLAIVAETVRAHGGTITIEDSPAGGARLVVELTLGDQSESPNT